MQDPPDTEGEQDNRQTPRPDQAIKGSEQPQEWADQPAKETVVDQFRGAPGTMLIQNDRGFWSEKHGILVEGRRLDLASISDLQRPPLQWAPIDANAGEGLELCCPFTWTNSICQQTQCWTRSILGRSQRSDHLSKVVTLEPHPGDAISTDFSRFDRLHLLMIDLSDLIITSASRRHPLVRIGRSPSRNIVANALRPEQFIANIGGCGPVPLEGHRGEQLVSFFWQRIAACHTSSRRKTGAKGHRVVGRFDHLPDFFGQIHSQRRDLQLQRDS